MARMKRRWDEHLPERRRVSKQNLRDNAIRFNKEFEENRTKAENRGENSEREDDEANNVMQKESMVTNVEWTLEIKVSLVKIDIHEREKGRGFMQRIKEVWDERYSGKQMTEQCLRDNAARFKKDKGLMNLVEVREGKKVTEENTTRNENNEANGREEDNNIENSEVEIGNSNGNESEGEEHNTLHVDRNERENDNEDEDMKEFQIRFMDNLKKLTTTTSEKIEERERLMKVKTGIKKEKMERANKILEKYLDGNSDMCKVIDAVYAMAITIEERLGLKRVNERKNKINTNGGNRRIRKNGSQTERVKASSSKDFK